MSQDSGSEAAGPAPPGPQSSAREIITRFGGIRPMAAKLGVAVSTVQGWRERGAIPKARHGQILEAARSHGVALEPEELAAAAGAPEPEATRTAERTETRTATGKPAEPEEPARPAARAGVIPSSRTGTAEDSRGRSMAIGAGILAAGLILAVLGRDLWLPLIGPQSDNARLATLERRVAALESEVPAVDPAALGRLEGRLADLRERIGTLESRGAGAEQVAALSGRVDDLTARLEALAPLRSRVEALTGLEERVERLSRLEQRVETLSGLEQRVERLGRLQERVAELETLERRVEELGALESRIETLAETSARARDRLAGETALAVAVLELRDALRGSAPFAREYATLEKLAQSGTLEDGAALAELIAPLKPLAEQGVPSLPLLREEFSDRAGEIVAAAQGGEGEDWVSGVLRRASGLVTLRPIGPAEGTSVPAIVARAEFHLGEGDLETALAELDALDGRPAAAVSEWRARAEARRTVERVLTGLSERLVRRVESAGG